MTNVIENITVLVSDPTDHDTPEVFTFVDCYVESLREARVAAKVRVSRMSVDALISQQQLPQPDLIVTIGHGSEDGKLVFEAGEGDFLGKGRCTELVTFDELPDNVQEWFAAAKCVMVFACHGSRWISPADNVKWIAFDKTIPQRLTTVFVQRLVIPNGKSMRTLVGEAMVGSLSADKEWLQSVEYSHPDPALYPHYTAGDLTMLRGSSDAFETYNIRLGAEGASDEFVGRAQLLHLLTIPPTPTSALPPQRLTWISGEAGQGKSALVRKAAERLRSYWFEDESKKPLVVALDLSNVTSLDTACERVVGALEAVIEESVSKDPAAKPEDVLDAAFSLIARRRQPLALVLDDTTYLDLGLTEETKNASHLAKTLLALAESHRVRFHGIITNRYPPAAVGGAHHLGLIPLHLGEAALLVYRLLLKLGRDEVSADGKTKCFEEFVKDSVNDVGVIFAHSGGNTKRFRRILDLAGEFGWSLNETAGKVFTPHLDLEALDRELVKREWEVGKTFGKMHRVNWRSFLVTLFPLVRWAGAFTREEYTGWLGEWTKAKEHPLPVEDSVSKCLDLACVKGILTKSDQRYSLAPNYRVQAAAFLKVAPADTVEAIEKAIREKIPEPRAVEERLALCLEMGRTGGGDDVAEFLLLRRELWPLKGTDERIDLALATAMQAHAEIAYELLHDAGMSLSITEELEREFGGHKSFRVVEPVAKALFNRTENLWEEGEKERYFKEVARFEKEYGSHSAGEVVTPVARALFNMTENLWEEGEKERYFKEVERFEEEYGAHPAGEVVTEVAKALFNRTNNLWEDGEKERYFQEVERFEKEYGSHTAAGVVERVAKALFNMTNNLWELGEKERYFQEVARFEEEYGAHSAGEVVAQVAAALFNMTCKLRKEGEKERYFEEVERFEKEYGSHPAAEVVKTVAAALAVRTGRLWEEGEKERYFEEVERLEEKYGSHPAAAVVEKVAVALFNRTNKLWEEGEKERYFQEVARFEKEYGAHSAAEVVEKVAMALVNMTENLWEEGEKKRYFEECERIITMHGERWQRDCEEPLERLYSLYMKRKEDEGAAD